jgi:hypothetical protein
VLLDDAGYPLEWSFLEPTTGTVDPGQTAEWEEYPVVYDGSASRIHVSFDYDAEPQAAASGLHSRPLSRSEVLALRNEMNEASEEN